MSLLSLPPEILVTIFKSVLLAHLGPERRLHPCSSSRYQSKGHQRREHSCPPLLLCCRDLHHIGKETFYQNVTIVLGLDFHSQPYYFRRYPTPEKDKHILSVLAGRTSVLPYIKNLELMISRTTWWEAPQTNSWQGQGKFEFHFWPNEGDPVLSISTITEKLPKLKTMSCTVGMGEVEGLSLSARPEISDNFPPFPLSTILKHQPCDIKTTRLRIWFTHTQLEILMQCAYNATPQSPVLDCDWDAVTIADLSSHYSLKPIIGMSSLKHLDIFLPYVPNGQLFEEAYTGEVFDNLKRLLLIIFSHVEEVRLWHAESQNVTSGDYDGADTRPPAVDQGWVDTRNSRIGGGGTFEARQRLSLF